MPPPDELSEQRIYDELHGLAKGFMRRERAAHTLQPTALVNEAYVRLGDEQGGAAVKTHFKALAARAMRRVLVDHSRRKHADKRGGDDARVTLHDDMALMQQEQADAIDLEQALRQLAEHDERKAKVVELRFFGGLSIQEAAEQLGISPKTVEADWYMARAWLRRRLKGDSDDERLS